VKARAEGQTRSESTFCHKNGNFSLLTLGHDQMLKRPRNAKVCLYGGRSKPLFA
jgi:hypothetical protein